MSPWPPYDSCEQCQQPDEWELFGCPLHGFEGKGQAQLQAKNLDEPWSRTCPRYFAGLPFVQEVAADLADYRRGALGPVQDLPAPLLTLLRAMDSEQAAWEHVQDARMRAQREQEARHG